MKENWISQLLSWYNRNKRDLPWRETKDPYLIYVSEIILQQTRVNQGMPYYQRFVSLFPNIKSLASCTEDEVLKAWEGLGYYSRGRNLRKAAQSIMKDHKGVFPSSHEEILELKGVGPYTAAAIGSIAFGNVKPAVDGNVLRVMSRFLNMSDSIDSSSGKNKILNFLETKIDSSHPGDFNQAMMELGATLCLPKSVNCDDCPLVGDCRVHESGNELGLPVRTKKVKQRHRFFIYLIQEKDGETIILKRKAGDVWEGLFEYPLLEVESLDKLNDPLQSLSSEGWISSKVHVNSVSTVRKHVLSHQVIKAVFVKMRVDRFYKPVGSVVCVSDSLHTFALPRIITSYLQNQV